MAGLSRADLFRRHRPAAPAAHPPGRAWTAEVGRRCLAVGSVECRVCGDHCAAGAIRFRPLGRGRWLPDVDTALCTGCGACVGPCPTAAMTLAAAPAEEETARCG